MEGHCSTGQSPQRAVVPTEEKVNWHFVSDVAVQIIAPIFGCPAVQEEFLSLDYILQLPSKSFPFTTELVSMCRKIYNNNNNNNNNNKNNNYNSLSFVVKYAKDLCTKRLQHS
jgi:hypothetical protein